VRRLLGFSFAGLVFLGGCATVHVAPPSSAPTVVIPPNPIGALPPLINVSSDILHSLMDDADLSQLSQAADASDDYFKRLPADQRFVLAGDTYTARDLQESVESFQKLLTLKLTAEALSERVKSDFILYQSVGADGKGLVTFSAYYEPTISARLQRDNTYHYPLLGRPDDLVDVDLGSFNTTYQGARIAGRHQGRALVHYYTREDIDSKALLAQKGLEIAWAKDPLDIFFLQIEGSGWLDLGAGQTLRIRYDGDNGRKYVSVGQYLINSHRAKAKGFGHDEFIRYMKNHPQTRQSILNVDERYIFFELDRSTGSAYAFGNISEPLTAGRSIATDPKLFPKGFLAWVTIAVPKSTLHRFVFNQDEGGAIQGAGRVDFFTGHGAEAEKLATHLWYPGQLYFLVKKPAPPEMAPAPSASHP
jgi:membrane-bound lytic murein transglycosylase A